MKTTAVPVELQCRMFNSRGCQADRSSAGVKASLLSTLSLFISAYLSVVCLFSLTFFFLSLPLTIGTVPSCASIAAVTTGISPLGGISQVSLYPMNVLFSVAERKMWWHQLDRPSGSSRLMSQWWTCTSVSWTR